MADDSIDITDLREPVLSQVQTQALAALQGQTMVLDAAAIEETARQETGLSRFGADDFRERLEVWVRAVNNDSGASVLTRMNMQQMFLRYAKNRLRLEDLIAANPQILDIEMTVPSSLPGCRAREPHTC